jgi:glucosamine--fructose-6-phosphate aminotransferase (isomerizing)
MCGIFGCLKNINSNIEIKKIVLLAINLLKNRGYDSCGLYLNNLNDLEYLFKFGIDGNYIKNEDEKDIFILLENEINKLQNNFVVGLSHTRWATHGGKTDENSHPHVSNDKKIYLVHNGIISNYEELKNKYLKGYNFYSQTDTEIFVNIIEYFKNNNNDLQFYEILNMVSNVLEGTWACIIYNKDDPCKLYFMKNENPLLLGMCNDLMMITSEPSGFLNKVDEYVLLRNKSCGYFDIYGEMFIDGTYNILKLNKINYSDIELDNKYKHWMKKEIEDQKNMKLLNIINSGNYNLNIDNIKKCKYLYIIACGSSYYAGLIASHYFRFTNAFEFVNVIDGSNFDDTYLNSIENPEENLLVLLISQSGETRDLDLATTICRQYKNNEKEIKIFGIINVVDSLLSRRTINNIYTECGRENAVASTKSCSSQILACLMLAIKKSELNGNLDYNKKQKFKNDLIDLDNDINNIFLLENKIINIADKILNILNTTNSNSLFILGKEELHGVALEGCLKIKEVAYIHAEAHYIAGFKHGVYTLVDNNIPIIIIYKKRNHFIKSVIEEIKTRNGFIIEISEDAEDTENNIIIPNNKTFYGIISVIVLQLLSYYLSILFHKNHFFHTLFLFPYYNPI